MSSGLFKLYDRDIAMKRGGCRYGMNTVDDQFTLQDGWCSTLENLLPGNPPKPVDGLVDIFKEATHRGRDGAGSIYVPPGIRAVGGDGDEYLFCWSRTNSVINTEYYQLEVINVTDRTRSNLIECKFSEVPRFDFLKLHNWLYCFLSVEITQNFTNPYLTKNMIIYWDSTAGSWAVRAMGIDVAPNMYSINIADSTSTTVWGARKNFAHAYHNNQVFVVGGETATGKTKDVYKTNDMLLWEAETIVDSRQHILDVDDSKVVDEAGNYIYDQAEFPYRHGGKMVSFGGYLYLAGGEDDSGYLADVWRRDSAGVWTRLQTTAEFGGRVDFGFVSHGGYLWIVGGYNGADLADVWQSLDGETWVEVTQVSAISARSGHGLLSYDDKLWVICGGGCANAYSSTDGATWTQVAANAGIGSLAGAMYSVCDGKMWAVGGLDGTYRDDARSSTDGITWTVEAGTPGFTARNFGGLVEFGNKLWTFGGWNGTTYYNDTWNTITGGTWSQATTGLTKGKYVSNAFTFVRRTDIYGVLQSIESFDYRPWETLSGLTVVGIDERLLVGTVSLSGANLTGTGTKFNSCLEAGQNIRIAGTYFAYEVVSVADDENAVIVNALSHSYTDEEFSLLPGVGDPITTAVFNPGELEGIEDDEYRNVIYINSDADLAVQLITIPGGLERAIALGATHIRHYRTLESTTAVIAEGLDHTYCADISIAGSLSQVNDTALGLTYRVYKDAIDNDTLTGTTNYLEMIGISVPPVGRFPVWAEDRLWLGSESGVWYYSSAPLNYQFPQKYASMFQLSTQKKICSPEDGQENMGAFLFDGNLFFAKERKLFVLSSADSNDIPIEYDGSIGVACPRTVGKTVIPGLGPIITWLSDIGPVYMTSGAKPEPLSDFTIGELWPGGEILTRPNDGSPTNSYSRESVSGVWHRNTYWILYGDSEDVSVENDFMENKLFGFNFSTRGKEYGQGPFKRTFAALENGFVYEPKIIISVDGNTAYSLCHKDYDAGAAYRVSLFSKAGEYQDRFIEETAGIECFVKSRYVKPDEANLELFVELYSLIAHCDLEDALNIVFSFYADEKRFYSSGAYTETVQTQLAGHSQFRRSVEVAPVGANFYGNYLAAGIRKTLSSKDDFKFRGFDFNVTPVDLGAEHLSPSGARQNAWS